MQALHQHKADNSEEVDNYDDAGGETHLRLRKLSVTVVDHSQNGMSGPVSSRKLSREESELVEKTTKMQHIILNKMKEQAKELQKTMLNEMELNLTQLMNNFISELKLVHVPAEYKVFFNDHTTKKLRKRNKDSQAALPEKEYATRNSLLTDLFEIIHIQTIYHIFIATLIILFLSTVLEDIVQTGSINFDFELIQWALGDFEAVVMTWIGMMLSTLLIVYPAFYCWSKYRNLIMNAAHRKMWDYSWLFGYLLYFGILTYAPVKVTIVKKLPPASATALLMEQVRLMMKTHAFVRSNITTSLAFTNRRLKNNDTSVLSSEDEGYCPDFSKFLYFTFAPTLVYKNDYPRTQKIRWNWVFWNFAQVIGVTFYLYFILERFCVPVFRQIGREPMSAKALILSIFGCMLPGTLVLLLGFYAILHSWLNAFAEMLRFGDRMFYQDWWNASSYATYYRTWNIVVHDWLYTYIYREVHELCGRRNRYIPLFAVFAVSSLVHEYIITFTFRCFYPILLFMFGGFGSKNHVTFYTNKQS